MASMIDLGLAGAGDAVEQGDGEGAGRRRPSGAASAASAGRARGGAGVVRVRAAERRRDRHGGREQQAGVGHGADDGGAGVRGLGQGRGGAGLPSARAASTRRRGSVRRASGAGAAIQPRAGASGRRALTRSAMASTVAGQGQGVGRDPVDQAADVGAHRRRVQDGGQRSQAVVADAMVGRAVPDHAHLLAPVERDQHDVAGLRVQLARDAVVEWAREGVGQQDGDAAEAVRCRLRRRERVELCPPLIPPSVPLGHAVCCARTGRFRPGPSHGMPRMAPFLDRHQSRP